MMCHPQAPSFLNQSSCESFIVEIPSDEQMKSTRAGYIWYTWMYRHLYSSCQDEAEYANNGERNTNSPRLDFDGTQHQILIHRELDTLTWWFDELNFQRPYWRGVQHYEENNIAYDIHIHTHSQGMRFIHQVFLYPWNTCNRLPLMKVCDKAFLNTTMWVIHVMKSLNVSDQLCIYHSQHWYCVSTKSGRTHSSVAILKTS